MSVTTSTISRWEQGVAMPKARMRGPLAKLLEVTPVELDGLLADAIDEQQVASLNGRSVPQWLGHFAWLEQTSAEVRTFEPLVVPALLQTEAYAIAVEQAIHRPVTPHEVGKRVEARLARQQVLFQDPDPLHLVCVIDEGVLLRAVGDNETMAGQLDHLAAMAVRPNIKLRIAPLEKSLYGAAFGAFQLMTSPGATSPYIACTEDLVSKRYHDAASEVAAYNQLFDSLYRQSLETSAVLKAIAKHVERFR